MEVELAPFHLKSLEQGDCSHNTEPADTRETVAPVRENSWYNMQSWDVMKQYEPSQQF